MTALPAAPSASDHGFGPIVILSSVQDFRLKRRGSIQAIAAELAREGRDVTFVSVRFSTFSHRRADPRLVLRDRANRLETYEGVHCFLWRTPFHPFNARRRWLNVLMTPFFALYARYPNAQLDAILRQAGTIVVESGLAIALLPRISRLNPQARLIYRGSDRLSAIGQHAALARILRRHQAVFDSFCLLGPGIATDFAWAFPKAFIVPPGFDREAVEAVGENPYADPVNAISLGAMLFDPSFFALAAARFPEVIFHIFGVPILRDVPANVRFHADIPYAETWRFIRHASFGIAPYKPDPGAEYLADTSSKLMQYGAVGLPSVCPHFAVGRHAGRFGYTPGDASSIETAVGAALVAPRHPGAGYRSWTEIVRRLLAPRDHPDTWLGRPAADRSEAGTGPAVSLIVATRGRVAPLARLLASLQAQPAGLFEVIVVDQNDPGVLDEVLGETAATLDLVHLRSAPGLSRARNVGLAASRGHFVGFPDDDCWYPPGRVADVTRFFAAYPDADILLGQTVDAGGTASVNAMRRASATVTPANVWFSGNSNTLFVRRTLAAALRFDEDLGVGAATPFQSGEETDLILRAMQGGARAIYCPNLTIFHEQVDGQIGRLQLRRAWRYATGFGQVLRRHYQVSYVAYRICRSLLSAVWAIAHGRIDQCAERFVWSVGTARGWLSSTAGDLK